jgi:hypothetical protein
MGGWDGTEEEMPSLPHIHHSPPPHPQFEHTANTCIDTVWYRSHILNPCRSLLCFIIAPPYLIVESDPKSNHVTPLSFSLRISFNLSPFLLSVQGLGSTNRSMSTSLSSSTVTGGNVSPPHSGFHDVNRGDSRTSLVSLALHLSIYLASYTAYARRPSII